MTTLLSLAALILATFLFLILAEVLEMTLLIVSCAALVGVIALIEYQDRKRWERMHENHSQY